MPEHPAEMPAEGEGGSGRVDWSKLRGGIGGGIGGPNELPNPDLRFSAAQLVNEVFRLRNRVHVLESNMLAAKMRRGSFFGGGIGGPNELPEGEGGGGGGEIHEIHEINEIAEMPAVTRLVAQLATLVARFQQFEQSITTQLGAINQRLDQMNR